MTATENAEAAAPSCEVEVDESVYPLDIGKTAAYLLTDRARVDIYRKAEVPGSYFVRLAPKSGKDADALGTEFANELLNTSLKEELTAKFGDMREQIIVTAITNSLREAMVTDPENAAAAPARSIDDVLKDLATEFDLKKSEDKIENL